MASRAMEIGDLPLCPPYQDGDDDDYLPLSPVEQDRDGDDYLPLSPVVQDGGDSDDYRLQLSPMELESEEDRDGDDFLQLSPVEEDGDDLPPEEGDEDLFSNALLDELRSQRLVDIIQRLRVAVTGARAPPDDPELLAAVAEALETVEPPSDDEGIGDCPICLQEDDGAATCWKETPCGHRFHGRCVQRWLQAKGSCPMCRRQLLTMPAAADATADAAYQELVRSDIFEAYGEEGVNSVFHGGQVAA